ncbi:hypothetical protein J4573_21565 [Actinomadura barringtoniae]|uniref:Uncharacterized protein n=1 Tax=Actinomadura barringtoniae TaxID=1427535 RepID=A0A939PBT9_9ACTN|nr:hypothetical protein [Actinomadura barringtoniae]MBO2449705.1 hypothetical protein [Actinomadura barringtoniae]
MTGGPDRTGLLSGLVDDAGLFPPTSLNMADAVHRHVNDQAARHPMLSHRFLCPASRLAELRSRLNGARRVRLGLIADTGLDGLPDALKEIDIDPRVELAHLEVPLAAIPHDPATAVVETRRVIGDAQAFFEPSSYAAVPETVRALGGGPQGGSNRVGTQGGSNRVGTQGGLNGVGPNGVGPNGVGPNGVGSKGSGAHGVGSKDVGAHGVGVKEGGSEGGGLKLRCGGIKPELFPSPATLANAIVTAVAANVPLKATAGLHEAVRHHNPETGFTHHGYLNLLLAVAEALDGAEPYDVRTALELTDPAALTTRLRAVTDVERLRRAFVSYGSCSTSTPIEQARALGLEEGPR